MKKILTALLSIFLGIFYMPVVFASSDSWITTYKQNLTEWESAGIKNATDPKIKQLYEQLSSQISEYGKLEEEYISELDSNATAMKEKEQSTENKLLGAAAIGATGIGGMQLAAGAAEQSADEDAEIAMRAYLATFHCNYGGGKNIAGGEQNVQLPMANLLDFRTEYTELANNLKIRKASLEMRPGIESEVILDSTTTGLYDDVAIGKTDGAFTSLARALTDETSTDAIEWNEQKSKSEKKTKTGGTIAAVGAVGGAVGNLIINKDAPKESSKKIKSDFDKKTRNLKSDIQNTEKELTAAIEENKKKIAEYNANLSKHQEFVKTITEVDCIEQFREYIDQINSLQPITDNFIDTSTISAIKYDLSEQQNTYAQCATAAELARKRTDCESKPNHVWQDNTCIERTPVSTETEIKSTTPITEENTSEPTDTPTLDEHTCIVRETNKKINTMDEDPTTTQCILPDGSISYYIKSSDGYCECVDMSKPTATTNENDTPENTCLMQSDNKKHQIGTDCKGKLGDSEYQGILNKSSDGYCLCQIDKSKLLPEKCTAGKKTVTQGDDCYNIKDGQKKSGFYFKQKNGNCVCNITDSETTPQTCIHNEREIATGKSCKTNDYRILSAINVRGSDGKCVCQATKCKAEYKLINGDCDTCANGFRKYPYAKDQHQCQSIYCPRTTKDMETLRRELSRPVVGDEACQEYCQDQHPVNVPEMYDTTWHNGKTSWTEQEISGLCQYNGHMLTFDKKTCICSPNESDRQAYQDTDNQKLNFFKVCHEDKNKSGATKEYCVKNAFANTQVQIMQGIALAQEYARVKNGHEIICNNTPTISNYTYWLSCSTIGSKYVYEFEFDDLEESYDITIDDSIAEALCVSVYDGSFDDGLTIDPVTGIANYYDTSSRCKLSDSAKRHALIASAANFAIDATEDDNYVIFGPEHETDEYTTQKIGNIDPFVFYSEDIQVQANTKIPEILFNYIANTIYPQTITSFSCKSNPKQYEKIDGRSAKGSSDDVLTCYLNGTPLDFVFDDMSEFSTVLSRGAYSNMTCKSIGGTSNGQDCMYIDKNQCELIKKIASSDPLVQSARWNEETGICELPTAAAATQLQRKIEMVKMAGAVLVTITITCATGGAGTPMLAAIFVAEVIGSTTVALATAETYEEIDEFKDNANKCRNEQCALELIKNELNRMSSFYGRMTDTEKEGIDEIFTNLIEQYVPEDSDFYKKILNDGTTKFGELSLFDLNYWTPENIFLGIGTALELAGVIIGGYNTLKALPKTFPKFTARVQNNVKSLHKIFSQSDNVIAATGKLAQQAAKAMTKYVDDLAGKIFDYIDDMDFSQENARKLADTIFEETTNFARSSGLDESTVIDLKKYSQSIASNANDYDDVMDATVKHIQDATDQSNLKKLNEYITGVHNKFKIRYKEALVDTADKANDLYGGYSNTNDALDMASTEYNLRNSGHGNI